jgi:hypothetical protein
MSGGRAPALSKSAQRALFLLLIHNLVYRLLKHCRTSHTRAELLGPIPLSAGTADRRSRDQNCLNLVQVGIPTQMAARAPADNFVIQRTVRVK